MIILQKQCFKRMLPLHDIVMALFDTVEEKHHKGAMDNLYNSADFFKVAYNHKKIYRLMMLHGKE